MAALIISIIAITISFGLVVFVFLWTSAADKQMKQVNEAAGIVKTLNTRITRLQNTANDFAIGISSRVKRCEESIRKTIEFPKGKE